MVDCFVKTVQKEGFFALFKGLWPNYIKVPPMASNVLRRFLRPSDRRVAHHLPTLTRGCPPPCTPQVVPSIAIAFVTYEQLKTLMGVDFKISE